MSRPHERRNSGWCGPVGRAETRLEELLADSPAARNGVAYLCGNPDMIEAVELTAAARGFPPEQVRKELYWPKGRAH